MIKEYSQYIDQWPIIKSYISNDEIDNYKLVTFIIDKIFEYNMINVEQLELNEKILVLNEEEIIPNEITSLLMEKNFDNNDFINRLLEWFYNDYKNHDIIMNKYKNNVFKYYCKDNLEEEIYKGEFNILFKNSREALVNKDNNELNYNSFIINKKIKYLINSLKKITCKNGVKYEGK